MKKSTILAVVVAIVGCVGALCAAPRPSQAPAACCDGGACCQGGSCCAAK